MGSELKSTLLWVAGGLGVVAVGYGLASLDTAIKARDYRPFAEVVEQCKTKGYVQDKKVRVLCDIERPMQPRAADMPIDHPPVKRKK